MTKLPLNITEWFGALPRLIADLYDDKFRGSSSEPLDKALEDLLQVNYTIWRYEDDVRRTDVPDKEIAGLKRNIDITNQKRNDLIDIVDAILKQDIEKKIKASDKTAPLNSETPGSIFDRLTVVALRARNLKKEIERKDASEAHIEKCSGMLKQVEERSRDLLKSLEELLGDYYSGRKQLKSYKQHKLYNDPELNPSLRK